MKILRRILNQPARQAKPASVALDVTQLSAEAREALLGRADADLPERLAAAAHSPYGATLCALAAEQLPAPGALAQAARQRLAALVDAGELPCAQLLADLTDTSQRLAIAALCASDELQNAVLAGIDDQAALAALCAQAPSAGARRALAKRIEQVDLLKQLAGQFKNRDKTVYKLLKAKLDRHRQGQQAAAEARQTAEELCLEIEQLVERALDRDYPARLHRVQRRWQELGAEVEPALSARFAEANARCEHSLSQAEEQQRAQQALAASIAQAGEKRAALIRELWQLLNKLFALEVAESAGLAEINGELEALRARWQQLATLGDIGATDLKRYTQLCEALDDHLFNYAGRGTLVACRNRIFSGEGSAAELDADRQYLRDLLRIVAAFRGWSPGESVSKAQAVLAAFEEGQNAARAREKKTVGSALGLIRKCRQAVDRGRTKQASGMRRAIDEKIQSLSELPANLAAQLETLDEALHKMADWKSYAVLPKKQALVDAMQALASSKLEPEALATKIKQLQDDWKALGQSGAEEEESLWQAFSEAGDRAFEPCRRYFQELAEVRRHNLALRQQLVEQVTRYHDSLDWENADWKAVEKILHNARRELYGYAPVERAAGKAVQAEFDAVMDKIQHQLDGEFNNNKAAKEQIVQQAEKLVASADLNQAIDAVKRLQGQWKLIGNCRHKDNEKLWQQFRQHCDAVFKRKDDETQQFKQGLEQNLRQAQALTAELDGLTTLAGADLLAARARKTELVNSFAELGELPRAKANEAKRRFAERAEAFDRRVVEQAKAAQLQSWERLFSAAETINSYLWAKAKGKAGLETLRAEVDACLASDQRWPEVGVASLQQKLALAEQGSGVDAAAAERALRLLCVRAEVLSGRETPAADKNLRMEYQVQQLQKGFGAAQVQESAAALAEQWVVAGAVDSGSYGSLFERFYSSWKVLG